MTRRQWTTIIAAGVVGLAVGQVIGMADTAALYSSPAHYVAVVAVAIALLVILREVTPAGYGALEVGVAVVTLAVGWKTHPSNPHAALLYTLGGCYIALRGINTIREPFKGRSYKRR